jgi:hypothetical protein
LERPFEPSDFLLRLDSAEPLAFFLSSSCFFSTFFFKADPNLVVDFLFRGDLLPFLGLFLVLDFANLGLSSPSGVVSFFDSFSLTLDPGVIGVASPF